MENRPTTCAACGCALAEGLDSCPLCGASVESRREGNAGEACPSTSPVRGSHAAAPAPASQRTKRLAIGIAAVGGAILLLVAGILVYRAWSADEALRQRAEEIAARPAELVRTQSAQTVASASNAPAGGGIAVADGDVRYWACAGGVYRQESGSADGQEPAQLLADESATCLNAEAGTLYYLSSSKPDAKLGTGTALRALKDPASGAGSSEAAETLFEAEDGATLSGLSVKGDDLYFIVSDDAGQTVVSLPRDGAGDVRELKRCNAREVWAFVEGNRLYVVQTGASSWTAETCDLNAESVRFQSWLSGSGQLQAACVSDGALFYSVSQAQGASHMCRRDASGASSEYDDVSGAVRIVAAGDVVASVAQGGKVQWTDAVTGFTYDASSVLDGAFDNPVPSMVGLSVLGTEICCAERAGGACSYNVNTKETSPLDVGGEVRQS